MIHQPALFDRELISQVRKQTPIYVGCTRNAPAYEHKEDKAESVTVLVKELVLARGEGDVRALGCVPPLTLQMHASLCDKHFASVF